MISAEEQLRQLLNAFYRGGYSLEILSVMTDRDIRLLKAFIAGNYVLSDVTCRKITYSLITDNESASVLLRELDEDFIDLPRLELSNS